MKIIGAALPAAALFVTGAPASEGVPLIPSNGAAGCIALRSKLSDLPGGGVRIVTQPDTRWPGMDIRPAAPWNLSGWSRIEARVANPSRTTVTVSLRVDDASTSKGAPKLQQSVTLAAGSTGTIAAAWSRHPCVPAKPLDLIGMRDWPGRSPVEYSAIARLCVFAGSAAAPQTVDVLEVRAVGPVRVVPAERFLPFVDRFGQFAHGDWPGKVRSEDELPARLAGEREELARTPPPAERTRWGGWAAGPSLKATGWFRTEKQDKTWWLVDPEGRLFWSFGVDCVRAGEPTPITDREHYFADLPPTNSPEGRFHGRGHWAPHGYYTNRPYRTFDFAAANLARKYGPGWTNDWIDHTLRRLSAWGWNTVANWSHPEVGRRRRIPYTYEASFHSPAIAGSQGYWGKFPDPFHPRFREGIQQSMRRAEEQGAVGDPWCLGFFIHNELAWGKPGELGLAALRSPADQPAKTAAVARLSAKYGDIDKLNAAWGAQWTSWEAMCAATNYSSAEGAAQDLDELAGMIADEYFRVIAAEVRAAAPNQLYLGCRFAWVNEMAIRAAARHCDVVSFNKYTYTLDDFRLPDGVDKPVVIGEFHFGALDRGMFHTGLRAAEHQADRAAKFASYVRSALHHPNVVGVHWFQYRDQALTGRGDGENYQIGLVDVCDTPYPEMVAAARQIAGEMYRLRAHTAGR